MDGYALRGDDVSEGAVLRVVESIAAGALSSRTIGPGEAARVMTGAPVPEGADSVIRREDTDDGRDTVTIRDARDRGRNIRRAGEDFFAGDRLFESGQPLSVPHLGVLASAGIRRVSVHRRPRVALITSGDELALLDEFDPSGTEGRIVSSNSVTLAASVRDAGAVALDLGIARDDKASLMEKLAAAADADLIITSAGISVGDHDHVRDAISASGGSLEFWKVRMRPGAPLAFGSVNGVPWIGLSGNPVSAIVTFELFVRPVLRRMLGFRRLFRATIPVRVARDIPLAAPLMHFLRVVVTRDDNGEHVADLAGSQSSAVLTVLARADALLILPGDCLEVAAGEIHRALPLGDACGTTDTLQLT